MKKPIATYAKERLLAGSILDEEYELEQQARTDGVTRYRNARLQAEKRGEASMLKPIERIINHWLPALEQDIDIQRRLLKRRVVTDQATIYGPLMLQLPSDVLAAITLSELFNECMKVPEHGGPNHVGRTHLSHCIGRACMSEMLIRHIRRTKDIPHKPGEKNRDELLRIITGRAKKLSVGKVNWWAKRNLEDMNVEVKVLIALGWRLLYGAVEVCSGYDENEIPWGGIHFKTEGGKRKRRSIVYLDDRVLDAIEKGHDLRCLMRPRYLPMIVPPCDWTSDTEGGYYGIRTPLVSKPRQCHKDAIGAAQLVEFYDCHNAVCGQPWRINGAAVDMIESLKVPGERAGLPPSDNPVLPEGSDGATDAELKEVKRQRSIIRRENVRRQCDRVMLNLRLNVAHQFRARESIYFPHQFDFRGRSYCIPQPLNPQGDDISRSLLELGEAKPTGDRGKWWIMVHVANCYGMDKLSFDDRAAWTVKNIDNISRALESPIGTDWWESADKPLQFLAACRALVDEQAAAHTPVGADGTCSGIQHYSALMLDREGGARVNLVKTDKPNSVYTDISDVAMRIVKAEGHEFAPYVMPHIKKETVKQPVMTKVYGSTRHGRTSQLLVTLKAGGLEGKVLYRSADYLSKVIDRSIGDVCAGASTVMDWLQHCAGIIARAGYAVQWTTPLGFPVVQNYRRVGKSVIDMLGARIAIPVNDESLAIMVKKQIDGVAPNFIHSLDATHMLMVARACRREGVAFAHIHDCFRSHAATMDDLHRITREQFVALYQKPILANLYAEWESKYGLNLPPPPPQIGTLDLSEVLEATYAWS